MVCLRKEQKQKGRVTHNDLQAVASIVQQSFVNPVNAGQKFGHQQRSTEKKSLVIRKKLFLNFVILELSKNNHSFKLDVKEDEWFHPKTGI